ncbi:MAG: hypothetical protein ACTJHU_01445 [Mycetocola sp.]
MSSFRSRMLSRTRSIWLAAAALVPIVFTLLAAAYISAQVGAADVTGYLYSFGRRGAEGVGAAAAPVQSAADQVTAALTYLPMMAVALLLGIVLGWRWAVAVVMAFALFSSFLGTFNFVSAVAADGQEWGSWLNGVLVLLMGVVFYLLYRRSGPAPAPAATDGN